MTQLKVICSTFTLVAVLWRHSATQLALCLQSNVTSSHLDDPSNDEFSALGAAGSIEDMEAMLAIFPVLELVEDSIRKLSEALGADEAPRAVQLTIAVHYLGFGFESIFTASTGHAVEVHNSWHDQRLAETRSRSVSRCVPRCSLDWHSAPTAAAALCWWPVTHRRDGSTTHSTVGMFTSVGRP